MKLPRYSLTPCRPSLAWVGLTCGWRTPSACFRNCGQSRARPALQSSSGTTGVWKKAMYRVEQLAEYRFQGLRTALPEVFAHPETDMVQAGPGDRGIGRDQRSALRIGDAFPGLDRAPVMGQQVYRAVRAGGADHRLQVFAEPLQVVVAAPAWLVRSAGATHVVGDDAVAPGQLADQRQPGLVVVRVAMHHQQRRLAVVRRAPAMNRQAHVAGLHEQAFRLQVGEGEERVHAASRACGSSPRACQRRTCGRSSSSQ